MSWKQMSLETVKIMCIEYGSAKYLVWRLIRLEE